MNIDKLANEIYTKGLGTDIWDTAMKEYPNHNTDLNGDSQSATEFICRKLEEQFFPEGLTDDEYDSLYGKLYDMVFNGLT